MNAPEFVAKWQKAELKERSAAQEHFLDLCRLLGHPTPAEADPTGEAFCFEKGAAKHGGGDGFADVWKKDFFGWEYKGKHKDLDAAWDQLLRYRDALANPPLLVACDLDRIVVHTNFEKTVSAAHEIPLAALAEPRSLEILRAVFFDPEKLRPGVTSEAVTRDAAARIGRIAQSLQAQGFPADRVARLLERLVFCLFAEDVGLLPRGLFTRLLANTRHAPALFAQGLDQLFRTMSTGGVYGAEPIAYFDGGMFEAVEVLPLPPAEIDAVLEAARLDWSEVDPSVFGTLFERGLDPAKRAQLGAHYTSREDIEALVEPVVMQPLRREWAALRDGIEADLAAGKRKARETGLQRVRAFLEELAHLRVLDPACGSGNFLYVTLLKLKDLEKEVILFASQRLGRSFLPLVNPEQLHGLEINPYAFELAQMTVWIGYLQWGRANGFALPTDPVLRRLPGFQCRDAILDLSDPAHPKEPEWPEVDCIVGNPPFLGTKKLRSELGSDYVESLFKLYGDRIPNFSDLCCYWFEKARVSIQQGRCSRAGLLGTQGIRGGLNREVLKRIKESGDIFFAISDQEWILNGANVHISMVGFDDGTEEEKVLDGVVVEAIHSNLTSSADITQAHRLAQNASCGFIADVKSGRFDIVENEALTILHHPNPHGQPNSDVILPWINSLDILRRDRLIWIIDFGVFRTREEAVLYELPFLVATERIYPERAKVNRKRYRELWWLHAEPCNEMRKAIAPHERFLVTPTVSKYRIFKWWQGPTLPDHQLVAFGRSDDYFFGVLHSRLHQVWALAQGTQLREKASGFRYTPTTCFETFPFPAPTPEQEAAIAAAAKELNELRERWLNPPEWTRAGVLEFPGTAGGPWDRHLDRATVDPATGVGTVRYPRLVPKDDTCAALLKKRTLTNLYNTRPAWLDQAHRKLDAAVFAAYGWDLDLIETEILKRLLKLNEERNNLESMRNSGESKLRSTS